MKIVFIQFMQFLLLHTDKLYLYFFIKELQTQFVNKLLSVLLLNEPKDISCVRPCC